MSLRSIAGHQTLIRLLRQAVGRDRVPQSLLFSGPEGVGKHTTAVALAQALNCPRRGQDAVPPDDACGSCPTCVRIGRGQHFDVVELGTDGAASIKIDPLRARVLDLVGYRPFEARRRVFIIDPADAMTVQTQDALLKTLEEPPPGSLLILVSAWPDTLVGTVQSRCRRLRFAPLGEEDVARVLVERRGIDPAQARVLAALSGGSIGRAVEEAAGELAGDRAAALALLAASAERNVARKLKASAALAQHKSRRRDREALAARLAVLASLLRDVAAALAGDRAAVANADVADEVARAAAGFDRDRLVSAWAALTHAQHALDRNASPKIVADWVALRI